MISLPTGPLLFDTGIYIRFSRGENHLWLGEDARVFQLTILTAVVDRLKKICRARSVFGEMEFVQHFRDLLIAMEAARGHARD